MAKAFTDTKQIQAKSTMLAHPLLGAPIALTTDASDYTVRAVHEQLVGDSSALMSGNTALLTANSLASTPLSAISGLPPPRQPNLRPGQNRPLVALRSHMLPPRLPGTGSVVVYLTYGN
ncbi:hypothetical protein AAFF_G00007940 [Aldrovandia affinis]|uniref:Reverse transcriptase/retrotransposon-derived protein RNase H-like domain-containing protein n=1 Tax=Aldrovandia affinis TaxID=143900 RepID=A0AAD7T683_9TELE|nr:hypothetical protein AAFF_G00007940 [Aldrovandia affinis]